MRDLSYHIGPGDVRGDAAIRMGVPCLSLYNESCCGRMRVMHGAHGITAWYICDVQANGGDTAAIRAASKGNVKILRALVAGKADINLSVRRK